MVSEMFTPTPAPSPPPSGFLEGGITWDGGGATLVSALIAATVVVIGYLAQQALVRRSRLSELYGEAIRAAHDYLEAPYLVRRRDGSASARIQVTTHISSIQSRLDYHRTMLRLEAPSDIADGYDSLVATIKREAGPAITAAWTSRPTKADRDVPLKVAYFFPASEAARRELVLAMRPWWRRGGA